MRNYWMKVNDQLVLGFVVVQRVLEQPGKVGAKLTPTDNKRRITLQSTLLNPHQQLQQTTEIPRTNYQVRTSISNVPIKSLYVSISSGKLRNMSKLLRLREKRRSFVRLQKWPFWDVWASQPIRFKITLIDTKVVQLYSDKFRPSRQWPHPSKSGCNWWI